MGLGGGDGSSNSSRESEDSLLDPESIIDSVVVVSRASGRCPSSVPIYY